VTENKRSTGLEVLRGRDSQLDNDIVLLERGVKTSTGSKILLPNAEGGERKILPVYSSLHPIPENVGKHTTFLGRL
jgi:hypothetical protein